MTIIDKGLYSLYLCQYSTHFNFFISDHSRAPNDPPRHILESPGASADQVRSVVEVPGVLHSPSSPRSSWCLSGSFYGLQMLRNGSSCLQILPDLLRFSPDASKFVKAASVANPSSRVACTMLVLGWMAGWLAGWQDWM